MTAVRHVIVNADDFGRSAGINGGVVHAHKHGIVTSASLMVRWPAAADAAQYARKSRTLSVGLHLDLGEWVCRDWNWTPLYEVVPVDDAAAVRQELTRQLAMFRDLVGRGPTHIDSHQHLHLKEPARALVLEAARRLGVPVRACVPDVQYRGDFYGQTDSGSPYPEGITAGALIQIGEQLEPGFTEIGCHPGLAVERAEAESVYVAERMEEVKALCDPQVRSAFAGMGIRLCSFADYEAYLATAGTRS